MVVCEGHLNVNWLFGKWNVITRFETTRHLCSLDFMLPFLKEGRKGMDINEFAGCTVEYIDLSIATKVSLSKTVTASCPFRLFVELFHLNILVDTVASH